MRILGCSMSSLYQYRRRGRIRATYTGKRKYDYNEEDVMSLMMQQPTDDPALAEDLVRTLGFDLDELRSSSRERHLMSQRRVITALLHREGFTYASIGQFLHRDRCSVIHMAHTAYLVEKEVEAAMKLWYGL